MKKKMFFSIGMLVCMSGFAQFTGTGPVTTDDQVAIGYNTTSALPSQLHVRTTGSIPFRIERLSTGYPALTHNNSLDIYFTNAPIGFTAGLTAVGTTIIQSANVNSDFLFLHGNSSAVPALYLKSGGNVGIGHAVANERLDVNGNIRVNDNRILFRGANDTYHGIGFNALNYNVNGPVLYGWDGGLLAANNNGTYVAALRWNNSGNVTIGSSSSVTNCRLTISTNSSNGSDNMINVEQNGTANFRVKANGYVYARDITVQYAAFPDYVFAPGYQLMPLHKLGTYVEANQHLPGFPSACAVEQNGMSVSEMNTLLVQKIEELTLYMIDLQKQIDALKNQQ